MEGTIVMNKKSDKRNSVSLNTEQKVARKRHRAKFSPALMEMAKREMEELEEASDRAFLIRMEMDRKLTSL